MHVHLEYQLYHSNFGFAISAMSAGFTEVRNAAPIERFGKVLERSSYRLQYVRGGAYSGPRRRAARARRGPATSSWYGYVERQGRVDTAVSRVYRTDYCKVNCILTVLLYVECCVRDLYRTVLPLSEIRYSTVQPHSTVRDADGRARALV